MGEQDFEKYFEENAVDGALPEDAMVKLLTGDLGDTGDSPAPEPEAGPATEQADDGSAGETPVVLAKDGKNTIPYEKLVEAREEAKAARAEREALMQEMESIKAMLAEKDAPKTEQADTEAGPVADELQDLKDQLADLPEVIEFVERYTGSQLKQVEMLKAQIEALTAQIEPIRKTEQNRVVEDHFRAITTAHADADMIVESPEFVEWKGKQPSFTQEAYDAVLERGTAQQVIELFDAFKASTGWGKTDATAGDTAAPRTVKVNTPKSLSDIPAGTAAPHDEAEALTQMSQTGRLQKMMNLDPSKIEDLMARLV
ncbi:MAG: hypothetical protein KA991_02160 [Bifidobacterium sp.]|nr:hypothetical protein [Bifidobacterium sp.]